MRDATFEKRVLGCGFFIGVRVEGIPGEFCEMLDVFQCDFARVGCQRSSSIIVSPLKKDGAVTTRQFGSKGPQKQSDCRKS